MPWVARRTLRFPNALLLITASWDFQFLRWHLLTPNHLFPPPEPVVVCKTSKSLPRRPRRWLLESGHLQNDRVVGSPDLGRQTPTQFCPADPPAEPPLDPARLSREIFLL